MSDETTLLPCPICGRKATVSAWWSDAEECGIASVGCSRESYVNGYECARIIVMRIDEKTALEDAIRIWNTRAKLGSGEPPYDELIRCLKNDWHINASWDGLRKFWCIELTEEGVRLRDAAYGTLTAERVQEAIERHSAWVIGNNRRFHDGAYEEIADELNAELGKVER